MYFVVVVVVAAVVKLVTYRFKLSHFTHLLDDP